MIATVRAAGARRSAKKCINSVFDGSMARPIAARAVSICERRAERTRTFLVNDDDAVKRAPSSTKNRQREERGGREWGKTCLIATLRNKAERIGDRQSP